MSKEIVSGVEVSHLAIRLSEHPRLIWGEGMVGIARGEKFAGRILVNNPFVTTEVYDGQPFTSYIAGGLSSFLGPAQPLSIPELQHPGTIGWLLKLLREERPEAFSLFESETQTWVVFDGPMGMLTLLSRDTLEGEALAAALLSVWGPA